MPPLERSVLRAVERELKARGILFRKRHGTAFGVAGDPDIYMILNGRHCEIELKRPGEEATPLQRLRLAEWERAGAVVGVVHNINELRAFLERLAGPAAGGGVGSGAS